MDNFYFRLPEKYFAMPFFMRVEITTPMQSNGVATIAYAISQQRGCKR